jgi:hypothetical protein
MIMSEAVLTAVIGGATSIIGGFVGWLMGRRKQKAEASILEIKGLDSVREFYEKVLQDNLSKLDYYIQLSEDNRKELHSLRLIVDRLVQDGCIRKGCTIRIPYDEEEVKRILHEDEESTGKKK